jgi:NAD(P)H-dependent flavin oxidoreductase YrpB (nitropropane dioxygenase family)
MLAGMDQVAGPKLAAAVCNAGGFGTLGGARYTPKMLKEMIAELKEELVDKNAPFGVDLLLPQVGGSARKTNVRVVQDPKWEYVANLRSMITRRATLTRC